MDAERLLNRKLQQRRNVSVGPTQGRGYGSPMSLIEQDDVAKKVYADTYLPQTGNKPAVKRSRTHNPQSQSLLRQTQERQIEKKLGITKPPPQKKTKKNDTPATNTGKEAEKEEDKQPDDIQLKSHHKKKISEMDLQFISQRLEKISNKQREEYLRAKIRREEMESYLLHKREKRLAKREMERKKREEKKEHVSAKSLSSSSSSSSKPAVEKEDMMDCDDN